MVDTNVASGKTYTKTDPHASYPDTGGTELTDGTLATGNYTDAAWVGWRNTNPTIRIDLSSAKILSYVRFHYRDSGVEQINAPASVVVAGSNDDSSYTDLGTFVKTTNWSTSDGNRWSDNLSVSGTYRYIRFTFTRDGADIYTFFSELEVYGSEPVTFIPKIIIF